MKRILIVDYGVGNIGSVRNMLEKVNATPIISQNPDSILQKDFDGVLLPGVGSYDAAADILWSRGWGQQVQNAARQKTPLLGICLGMQLLLTSSEEGKLPGLNLIPGTVKKFETIDGLKVPHMGWSLTRVKNQSPISTHLDGLDKFYYVHSYYATTNDEAHTSLVCEYGSYQFAAGIRNENIFGVQFHPEKSHKFGMRLFRGFLEFC